MKSLKKKYLGDGVFAEFVDYDHLILTTENGTRITNTIHFEVETLNALLDFVKDSMLKFKQEVEKA